jgi:hypothetical protein
MDITDESEGDARIDKSVKTGGSKRKLPIHPKLIELGFLDYVAAAKKRGDTLLFQAFPTAAGRASPKAMKWFTEFLQEIGLRDETQNARIVGMHMPSAPPSCTGPWCWVWSVPKPSPAMPATSPASKPSRTDK